MSVTLAELDDRTLSGLGDPEPEVCSLEEAHNAVVQALNVKTAQTIAYGTKSILSRTAEFYPNDIDYDITSLVGSGTPIRLEIKTGDAHYIAARFCDLDNVNCGGSRAYSFYSVGTNETGALRQFIRFNTIPAVACRILFDADKIKKSMGDVSHLPDYVSELIVILAQNALIPKIKLKYSMNFNRNEQERKDAQMIMNSFDGIYAGNLQRIPELEQLWRVWSFKDNKQQNGFTKRTPSGRSFYGD